MPNRTRPAPARFARLASLAGCLAALSCSDTIAVRRPLSESTLAELNMMAKDRQATVVLDIAGPARSYAGTDVKIGRDTTQWLPTWGVGAGGSRRSAPTNDIREIVVVRRGTGAAEGLGLGTLVGLPSGAVVGGILGAGIHDCDACGFGGAVVVGLIGAATGAFVGAIVGLIAGHRTTISFTSE
jgi:hypothetical protein